MLRIADIARENKGVVFNLLFSFLVIAVGPFYIHEIKLIKGLHHQNALIAFTLFALLLLEPYALYLKINSIYAGGHVKREFTLRYILLWLAHIFVTIMALMVMAFAMPDALKFVNIPMFWVIGVKEFLMLFYLLNRQISEEPRKDGTFYPPPKKIPEKKVFSADIILSAYAFLIFGITWQSVSATDFLSGMMNDLADSITFRIFTYLFMFALIYYPIRLGHFIEEWLTNRNTQQKRNYYLSLLITMASCIGPLFRGPGLPPANEINVKDEAGKTPLISAIEYEPIPYLKELIEHGADLNAQDTSGYAALHYAAKGGRPEALKLLLEYGAKPDLQTRSGITALAFTAGFSKAEAMQTLLKFHADPNVACYDGVTPLMLGAEQGFVPEIVEMLLTYKANANALDSNGYNAIMRFSHFHNLQSDADKRILKALLKNADLTQRDREGHTMVWHAMKYNGWPYIEVARELINAGAPVDSADVIDKDGYNMISER